MNEYINDLFEYNIIKDINGFVHNLDELEDIIYVQSLNLQDVDMEKLPDLSKVIIIGDFYCGENWLTSLEGSPKEVHGNFDCFRNNLTDLKGAPKKVSGNFICKKNDLVSLEGAPEEIGGYFDCSYNELTTLKGSPKKIGKDFECSLNKLTSLEGAPEEIEGNFLCTYRDEPFEKTYIQSFSNIKGEIYG